jgi:hypothetical protein
MTEKFICTMCGTACSIEITFSPGDEKTKQFLTCPFMMKNFFFENCNKAPGQSLIKILVPETTEQQRKRIEETNCKIKNAFRNCLLCIHYNEDGFCFSHCRGFSEYKEMTAEEKIKKTNPSFRGNA